MRRCALAVCAAVLISSSDAAAGFASETRCTGNMVFPNPDGSSETYAMELTLTPNGYRIVTTSLLRDETTQDEGTCTRYLSATCRHDLAIYGERVDDHYTFHLRPMTDTTFSYEEIWKDGATGRTVLTCQPG
ncbi:MAG: hypothetical protein AAFY75_08510 [Pseudomonadota bacterium]